MEHLEHGFSRVIGRYGFMEQPNAPELLVRAAVMPSIEHTTFFLGRENFIAAEHRGMATWRIHLFAALARNAQSATQILRHPPRSRDGNRRPDRTILIPPRFRFRFRFSFLLQFQFL